MLSDVFLYAYAQKWYTSISRSLNHTNLHAQLAKLVENEPLDCSPSHFESFERWRDVCDLGVESCPEGIERRISYLHTQPNTIVDVSNGLPLRCLRGDMVSDYLSEE